MLVIEKEKRRQKYLDAKRRLLEERCRRIHDPKWSFMGLDLAALEEQIKERKERDAEECKRDAFYENLRNEMYTKAAEIEKQQEEAKKKAMKEMNEFRLTQQAPHKGASFDINDPTKLKEPIPRFDDPCLSVSSAQRFLGEDPNCIERKRAQICQLRSWLDQQVMERRSEAKNNQYTEEQYKIINDRINRYADQKEKHMQDMKLQIESDIRAFNKKLAEEAAQRRCEEKKFMEGDGGHVMYSCYLGPALTEDRGVPRSSEGWRKVVMDMYKGMSPAEKADIRNQQLEAIRERKEMRAQEVKADAAWNAWYDSMYKLAYCKEQEECRKKAETERHIKQVNLKLAQEQKQRRELEDNCLYRFHPTEEYFNQFGSSP